MRKTKLHLILLLFLWFHLLVYAGGNYQRLSDGILVTIKREIPQTIRLKVVTDDIVHVQAIPEAAITESINLIDVYSHRQTSGWDVQQDKAHVILQTKTLKAMISLSTGEIRFADVNGKILLNESTGGGKTFERIEINDKTAYTIRQTFDSPDNEAFFGLGQHQSDEYNYKGRNEELYQCNTKVSIPFIVSSNSYGLLWNNYSLTRFGDPREYAALDQFKLYDKNELLGGLTATYTLKDRTQPPLIRQEKGLNYENTETVHNFPINVSMCENIEWEGYIEPDTTGTYRFKLTYAGYVKVYLDGKLVVPERWRASYTPNNAWKFQADLTAGEKHKVKIEWREPGGWGYSFIGLKALSPRNKKEQEQLSFWSEAGDQIDYYFIRGDNIDAIVKGYRTVTGKAPIVPKWALGFWQSRDKYMNQFETVGVVKEYRKRNIPIDNIVQDWDFWLDGNWGSHDFDSQRFPRPEAMIDSIHDLDARIMITVWPKFHRGSAHYDQFQRNGWLYTEPIKQNLRDFKGRLMSYYDAFSPEARNLFWDQLNDRLYSKGIDAWWLDASEPSIQDNISVQRQQALMNPTALGPSIQYFSAYPMLNSKGIYEGQRKTNPNERVYILTRSGFFCSQHYGSTIWSGDIAARWEDLKAQISAGLNFAITGMPYWTTDIGGYCVDDAFAKAQEGSPEMEEWRELYTRWFQFGAFCPIFRSHGKFPYREIYNVAPEEHPAYKSAVYYNRLRYRLMPYIYSLAGWTYHSDYTIMRPLVMDFCADDKTHNVSDQYMFGPSLMVCPIYSYRVRERDVYFPKNTAWYNYETNEFIKGGQTLRMQAPYERIPLFVKAGTIIPSGKDIQNTKESQAEAISLTVYAGQDGHFTLYEDEETNYNYEKGNFSMIPFSWNDNDKILTIDQRIGAFQGMLNNRIFRIIVVGFTRHQKKINAITEITYKGETMKITFKKDFSE